MCCILLFGDSRTVGEETSQSIDGRGGEEQKLVCATDTMDGRSKKTGRRDEQRSGWLIGCKFLAVLQHLTNEKRKRE